MIKVFISHQQRDSVEALRIGWRLKHIHGIEYYLDVVDEYIDGSVNDLAAHIRKQMGACTQLLALFSKATQDSWWVPWEIGVATEKEFPLATYSVNATIPPEYLRKWPYLRNLEDVDQYAAASKQVAPIYDSVRGYVTESASIARAGGAKEFYRDLKRRLGQ